jgi:hypothetical protein
MIIIPFMAGYSQTPLLKKLGYRENQMAWLIGVPESLPELAGFAGVVASAGFRTAGKTRRFELVHWFLTSRGELEAGIAAVGRVMRPDAALWISWPKKASKVPTDITEDVLRTVVLPTGLVDVKVCAVDAVWSGLKFMFRRELRASLDLH